jgi:hypothetical protein
VPSGPRNKSAHQQKERKGSIAKQEWYGSAKEGSTKVIQSKREAMASVELTVLTVDLRKVEGKKQN